MRPYILEETNWKAVKHSETELVVLPWGATEAHNYHLPYSTDTLLGGQIAAEAARIAYERGAKLMVLPTVPFGVHTGQPDITLNINMNPGTQFIVLKDLITVLDRQGIYKLVILNAHGGNDFKQMIRELNLVFPKMFLSQCHWFAIPGTEQYFEDLGGHGAEIETSLMLHLFPQLVLPLSEAGNGEAAIFSVPALNSNWAWAERQWSKVTKDTGIGNPALATAEKGEVFFKVITEMIGTFFFDLAKTSSDDLYCIKS